MTGLHAKNVTLLTMPTVTDPANVNRLLPEEPEDDVIFQLLADGQSWTGRLPVMRAGQVKVQVMNGTGTPGLAKQTARQLRALGFDVTGTGNAAATSTTTVNYAGTAQADSAYTLLTQLKGTPAAQNTLAEPAPQTGAAGTVTLTLGADWAGVLAPSVQHASTGKTGKSKSKGKAASGTSSAAGQGNQASVQTRNAGASICSGLPQANPDPGGP
jgi:hypothetical protein